MVWWLLFAGGAAASGSWFGLTWRAGSLLCRAFVTGALSICSVFILFTEFVFLQRGVKWIEVAMIVPWIFCICVLLAIAGGTIARRRVRRRPGGLRRGLLGEHLLRVPAACGAAPPKRRGHLYTAGHFRFSRILTTSVISCSSPDCVSSPERESPRSFRSPCWPGSSSGTSPRSTPICAPATVPPSTSTPAAPAN